MIHLEPVEGPEVPELLAFLEAADLTTAGLDAPGARYWLHRDERGAVVGSTGFELAASGTDALIRSVAVVSGARQTGLGSELARFALAGAASAGAQRAWLFSRRSGPFWQKLGFERSQTTSLATALASTSQVALFTETGQIDREVAWSRPLP